MLHLDVGDQSGSIARTALSTGYAQPIRTLSTAHGAVEDLMTVVNSQLGQAQCSLVPDDYSLQAGTGDLGSVQRTAQRRRVPGVPVPPKIFLTILKTSFIESVITGGISRIQCLALSAGTVGECCSRTLA